MQNNLGHRIKTFIEKILYHFSREHCYNMRKDIFGMCHGVVGGDKYTDYLSYSCVDCPYFTEVPKEYIKRG